MRKGKFTQLALLNESIDVWMKCCQLPKVLLSTSAEALFFLCLF